MSASITAIQGFQIGHFTERRAATGCTVVVARGGATAGVDVRGAAPATRETDLLAPWATVRDVHAVLLTGGSAFGLAAASGVVDLLEEEGIGFAFGGVVVPIVPAAAIFDLAVGDASVRPGPEAGRAATRSALDAVAGAPLEEGSVGAGTGATVAKALGRDSALRGGVGCAAHAFPDGAMMGGIAVVNALGDITDPADGTTVAAPRDGRSTAEAFLDGGRGTILRQGESTTLAIVLTDVELDKSACTVVARMAHDGLARAISPCHTPLDGDVVFALSSRARRSEVPLAVLGHVGAELVARAIVRGVRRANRNAS